jgi:hypothetical protein
MFIRHMCFALLTAARARVDHEIIASNFSNQKPEQKGLPVGAQVHLIDHSFKLGLALLPFITIRK